MPIDFACACGRSMRVPDDAAGKRAKCKDCGIVFVVPDPKGASPVAPAVTPQALQPTPAPGTEANPYQPAPSAPPSRVAVVDFDVPFWSLVVFLVKLSVASIPAAIILYLVWVALAITFYGAAMLGGGR